MFCKWCGSNIQLTDRVCPKCGRETPPVADCGGFYDLKHSGNAAVPTPAASIQCPIVEKVKPLYVKDRKEEKKLRSLTFIFFAVLLLAIIFTAVSVRRINERIDSLEMKSKNIQTAFPQDVVEYMEHMETNILDIVQESIKNAIEQNIQDLIKEDEQNVIREDTTDVIRADVSENNSEEITDSSEQDTSDEQASSETNEDEQVLEQENMDSADFAATENP